MRLSKTFFFSRRMVSKVKIFAFWRPNYAPILTALMYLPQRMEGESSRVGVQVFQPQNRAPWVMGLAVQWPRLSWCSPYWKNSDMSFLLSFKEGDTSSPCLESRSQVFPSQIQEYSAHPSAAGTLRHSFPPNAGVCLSWPSWAGACFASVQLGVAIRF